MQVPALIYGFYPEVERRARRAFLKMKRGATLEEALGANQLIESDDHDGFFSLNYADRPLGGQPHFHIIYALSEIGGGIWEEKLPETLEETVFHACLEHAWGVLLLLPHSLSGRWVKPEHRWLPFLRAAARFWPLLEAVGARYTYGSTYQETLSATVTAVDYVLGNAGIWRGGIEQPVLPPDWPALVEAYAERRARQLH
ncbi:MAG TPA: hypothetical protein VH877_16205 [Polyangia bacterium]|jgi:hypothetical protein|nr:hypothetical protein [Polyangia bacterium]